MALPKRKRGDVPCPVSCPVAPETCPHTLAHYCGPSGGNKGSMAWLEAALLSIVLALFISNTISIFMSKGVVPMLARAVLNKQAGPSATFEEERKAEEELQDADAAYMATFQPDVKEPPTPETNGAPDVDRPRGRARAEDPRGARRGGRAARLDYRRRDRGDALQTRGVFRGGRAGLHAGPRRQGPG